MNTIDILLQGEDIADVEVLTLPHDAKLILILEHAARLRGYDGGGETFHIFIQEQDKPLRPDHPLPRPEPGQPLCVHVHRCLTVEVEVTFNGAPQCDRFPPSRTVGGIKEQVATRLFGMTRHDAAEHVLQITGTNERPDVDTHVGALAKDCRVAFDLVPLVRVEG